MSEEFLQDYLYCLRELSGNLVRMVDYFAFLAGKADILGKFKDAEVLRRLSTESANLEYALRALMDNES